MLKRADDTLCSGIKAYKKEIDGLIFPHPRKIVIHRSGPIGENQRQLRISGPTGERTALAHSETVPEGSYFDVEVEYLSSKWEKILYEIFDSAALRGFGQWRNSGAGRATWELLDKTDA